MLDLLFGAVAGSALATVARKIKAAFREGEAIELVAGIAYLRMLAAEHDDLPDAAHLARLSESDDPADAMERAIATLEASSAFHDHGTLLRALGLPSKLQTLVRGAGGAPADIQGLLEGTALDEHSETILATLEGALNAAMTGPGRFRTGEFHTPPRIVDLMTRLLAPAPGSRIYDPTCGTGSLLLGAFDAATNAGGAPPEVFGQDINPTAVAFTRVRTHLKEAPAEIALGDVLADPAYTADGQLRRFDYVVSNLPRGVKLPDLSVLNQDPYGRFDALSGGRAMAEATFLLHAAASLADGGRAVVTTAPTLLNGSGPAAETRASLIEQDLVEAVVTLPREAYEHAVATPPPIIVLNRSKSPDMRGKVLFIEGETSADDVAKLAERIVATFRAPANVRRFAVVADGDAIAQAAYNLRPSAYVALVETERFMGGRGQRVRLSQIADVLTGGRAEYVEGGAEPLIKARDLRDRALSLDELDRVSVEGDRSELATCQAGDILMQEVGRRPMAVEVSPDIAGAIVHRSVIIVRPKKGSRHLAGYLAEFFNSGLGQAFLSATVSSLQGAMRVNARALRDLQIPVPDETVLQFISEVRSVEHEVVERRRRAQELRDRLFKLDDPERFDNELRELKTESEVLARSLVQVDSLPYRVRNFYPFPVAYRYRELEGIGKPHKLHKSLLEVAEGTLSYLGSIGLVLAARVGALDSEPNLSDPQYLREKFWGSGATLGNWREIAYRSAKTIRKRAAEITVPAVAADFASMWFSGRGQKASEFYKETTERLSELRNDEHHGRGPSTDAEYKQENDELRRLLDDMFAALEWTVSYPLRLVTRIAQDWEAGTFVADTVLYTGDHPGLRSERVQAPSALPDGHLYLEAEANTWVSLYPLITVQFCPSCKRSETYFIDRWAGPDNRTVLKSFERGHPLYYKQRGGTSEEARRVSKHMESWLRRVDAGP